MPTLPIRFITSSRGPANSLEADDLSFLCSEPDYPSALQRMKDLARDLAAELSGHELFIYRMSRPARGIHLWRQDPNSQGNNVGNAPPDAKPIGFAIYAAPKGLADRIPTPPNVSKLTEGVLFIATSYGQHGPPSDGGP